MATTITGSGVDKFDGTTIAGHVIQVANFTTGAYATGTALIPFDNTIPQITEGTQFMSLAFTPKKANSKLKIEVVLNWSTGATGRGVVALFRDSGVNAIATIQNYVTADESICSHLIAYVDSLSIASTTFTVRAGEQSAGTIHFNGQPTGGAAYGGSLASSITITEIAQ